VSNPIFFGTGIVYPGLSGSLTHLLGKKYGVPIAVLPQYHFRPNGLNGDDKDFI